MLLEEAVGPLTPKQTELLIDARDNAERLLALIEQLLALARLQRTQDRAAVPARRPGGTAPPAADGVRPRAEDKHVELEVVVGEPLPPVAVDPERIGQALGNLAEQRGHLHPGRREGHALGRHGRMTAGWC